MDNLTPDSLKTCTRCNETKPLSEYYLDDTAWKRYLSVCKECKRERVRAARAKAKEKLNECVVRD